MSVAAALAASAMLCLLAAVALWSAAPMMKHEKIMGVLAGILAGASFWVALAAIWVHALA